MKKNVLLVHKKSGVKFVFDRDIYAYDIQGAFFSVRCKTGPRSIAWPVNDLYEVREITMEVQSGINDILIEETV